MIIRAEDIRTPESIQEIIQKYKIDFFDFGCSRGGNIGHVHRRTGGHGLGFDINEMKLQEAHEAGYIVTDLNILEIPGENLVNYGHFSDMLEHLHTIDEVRNFIEKACCVCRRQILIRQPYIDSDLFLMQMGLKSSYSHWTGHKMNLTTPVLFNLLNDIKKKRGDTEFMIYYTRPILNSDFERIFSIHADIDSKYYDPSKDIPKANVVLPFPHFYQINGVIFLNGRYDVMYRKISRPAVIMYDSRTGYINQDIFLKAYKLSLIGKLKGFLKPKIRKLAKRVKGMHKSESDN